MLDAIDIAGLDITADALLTQRDLAKYVVARGAHYHFSVKGNQPTLQDNIRLQFERRGPAHYTQTSAAEHGRIETRKYQVSALPPYPGPSAPARPWCSTSWPSGRTWTSWSTSAAASGATR